VHGSVLLHTWRAASSLPKGKIALRFKTVVEFGHARDSASRGTFDRNSVHGSKEQDLFKLWIQN
jgi:hypothetical protein